MRFIIGLLEKFHEAYLKFRKNGRRRQAFLEEKDKILFDGSNLFRWIMNLSHYSLNAIFECFLADFRPSIRRLTFGYVSSFGSKIRRKTISNLIIKINEIDSWH